MSRTHAHDRIEAQAARWVARSEAPGWSTGDQAALDAWLDESDAHRVAWLRLRSVWRRADRLAVLRAPERRLEDGGSHAHTAGARKPRPARTRWRAAAAVLVLAALAGGTLPYLVHERDTYSTSIGGQQTVPLADGSRLELNTHTRLRAAMDERRREVWLQRGEAYFDVKPDPARPFVVHAGGRRVTVLGTRFSVRRDGARFEVVVQEGRVRVDDAGTAIEVHGAPAASGTASQSADGAPPPLILGAGQIAYADLGSRTTLVASTAPTRIARELSWRQGLLSFESTPLDAVASEFNRYHRRKLVIADAEAAAIPIGGTFEAGDLDAFVRLLQRGFGLKATHAGDEIRVSRH